MTLGWSEAVDLLPRAAIAIAFHSVFVMLVLATTAIQTFKDVQHNETAFSHANQVKNMLAQFGTAFGVSGANLVLQWRSTLHYAHLTESITAGNQALEPILATLTQAFEAAGTQQLAGRMAFAHLSQQITREATILAGQDFFLLVAIVAAIGLAVAVAGRGMQWLRASTGSARVLA
jgi:hypothetical protein